MSGNMKRRSGSVPRKSGAAKKGGKAYQFNEKEKTLRVFLRGRPIVHHTPDDYDPESNAPSPSHQLDLNWVYGYRGKDARNNLLLLPKTGAEDSDELIYFTAAVVIIYNPTKQYQRHYLEHTDDIKCLTLHPDPYRFLVASGQVASTAGGKSQPPHIRIWNYNTLETFMVIEHTFERQIIGLSFSKADGGKSLACIDDSTDHVLTVWDWEKADGAEKLYETKTTKEFHQIITVESDTVLGMMVNPANSDQIVTYGKGHVIFLNLQKDKRVLKKNGVFGTVEKPKIVTCAEFTPNGDLLTGDSNGTIIGWKNGSNHSSFCITNVHQGPVFTIQIDPEGDIVTGGGKDGRIVATNPEGEILDETSLPEYVGGARCVVLSGDGVVYVGTTRNGIMKMNFEEEFTTIMQGHYDSLWGISTHKTLKSQFMTAGFDGRCILWDSEYHKPVWTKIFDKSLQCCDIHPSESVGVVGTYNGEWKVIELENGDIKQKGADGRGEAISLVKFSPDGKFLAVGSHDNNIYIYQFKSGNDFLGNIDKCRQITQPTLMKDVKWATYTCPIGFEALGIWPEGADGTDINAIDRSNGENLIAVADDFGKVRLFHYPAIYPKANSDPYQGHSSHVTNVTFTADDAYLISTGGNDAAILQWNVSEKEE